MADSLVIAEQIELIGTGTGPVPSVNPLCLGATFWLQTGFDLSAPQPTTDIVGSLLLDGERPFGYRSSNRTITLPIEIAAPDFPTLTAAREVLMTEINQQTWTLRWTRDTTGQFSGTGPAMPLLFDCFRAQAAVWTWGGVDQLNRQPIGQMTITFQALPYARSDTPVLVNFPSPLAGMTAPPVPVTVDAYGSVSGTQWAASPFGPGGPSAEWSPTFAPGTWQILFTGNGSVANPKAASGTTVAVTVGKTYAFSAWVMSPQGYAAGGSLFIDWYTAGAVYLSSSSVALTLAAGTPFLASGSGTAPATAATGTLSVQMAGTPANTVQVYVGGAAAAGSSPGNAPLAAWTALNSATVTNLAAWANNTQFGNGAGMTPVYTVTGLALNLTGLSALTFWAGFGSTFYYHSWARLGGRVTFAFTLTDNAGKTLSFSATAKCNGGNSAANPVFQKIRVAIPQAGSPATAFNYANVAGYSVTVTNRSTADLRYTQCWISQLIAVPPPVAVAQPTAGAVYDMCMLPGTARAPVSLQLQLPGTSSFTRTLSLAGAGSWVCPPGCTTVSV